MSDKIYIAGDHASPRLKAQISEYLTARGIELVDLGTNDTQSVDFPDYAHAVANKLAAESQAKGILICGTGIGISIAANRHPHVRAALCRDVTDARLTRQHNDANILVLGARTIGDVTAIDIVDAFVSTEFEGGRHQRRLDKLTPTP